MNDVFNEIEKGFFFHPDATKYKARCVIAGIGIFACVGCGGWEKR